MSGKSKRMRCGTERNIEKRKLRLGMSLCSRKVARIGHSSRKKRGMHRHLLVLLHRETKVTIKARIHRTSELELLSLKEVWKRDVLGLLHVLGFVGTTKVNVVIDRHIALSVVKRATS